MFAVKLHARLEFDNAFLFRYNAALAEHGADRRFHSLKNRGLLKPRIYMCRGESFMPEGGPDDM